MKIPILTSSNSDRKVAPVCGDVRSNQQHVLVLHVSSGARLYTVWQKKKKKLDFTRYPSDHPDHMESDCGSFADHQQCLGKAGKSREEREDTKHTQAITMYDKKLPSLVIIRRERERGRQRATS